LRRKAPSALFSQFAFVVIAGLDPAIRHFFANIVSGGCAGQSSE
jgi:hypothetical protein